MLSTCKQCFYSIQFSVIFKRILRDAKLPKTWNTQMFTHIRRCLHVRKWAAGEVSVHDERHLRKPVASLNI